MTRVRVTRFSRHTRYAILVPNKRPKRRPTKRTTRTTKKQQGQPVQLPLPFHW
jgi:hypothetical protein